MVEASAEARRWMAQWRSAAVALERVRVAEMQAADLDAVATQLDDATRAAALAPGSRPDSGLIEQQRLFQRARGG
jgi:hypothetical protein